MSEVVINIIALLFLNHCLGILILHAVRPVLAKFVNTYLNLSAWFILKNIDVNTWPFLSVMLVSMRIIM